MYVSLATLCTTIASSCLLLLTVTLICRWTTSISKLYIYAPIIGIGIIAIRFLLPFEWSFTHTILIGGRYALFSKTLHRVAIDNSVMTFTLWDVLVCVSVLGAVIKSLFLWIKQAQYVRHLYAVPVVSYIDCKTIFGTPCKAPYIIDDTKTAFTFGLLKPRIVLPNTKLSTEERRLIIAHEVAHIESGDLWIKYFVEIVCTLYWWNPFMMLLRANTDNVLETRVDAKVMQPLDQDGRIAYLECLQKMIELSRSKKRRPFFTANFASMRAVSLKNRLDLVNGEKQSRPLSNILVLIILVIAIGTSFVVFEPYGFSKEKEIEMDSYSSSELTQSYLVMRDDGEYDLYMNGQLAAKISDIAMMNGIAIYNSLEEVPK